MKLLRIIILHIFSSLTCLAQNGSIIGKVVKLENEEPLIANVFLSNTSFGTICATNGTFSLTGLNAGEYTLVVSYVGYKTFTKLIFVNSNQLSLLIQLDKKTIQLQEVSISSPTKAEWKSYYEQFKDKFLGRDKNSDKCKILNPDAIYFKYDKKNKILSASTDIFLTINNESLGYRIKFLLDDFNSDGINNTISYVGQALFEELSGTEAQRKKWIKNRKETYLGSARHFYRSLIKDSMPANGFEIYHLHRQAIPKSPITRSGRYPHANITEIQIGSGYTNETLDKDQWKSSDILKATGEPNIYSFAFPDYLYVVYKNKGSDNFSNLYRPGNLAKYQVTIVSLLNHPPNARLDINGSVVSEAAPFYEGSWSKARLSELLPVDYTP